MGVAGVLVALLEDRTASLCNLSRSDCWHCVTGGLFDPPPVGNEFYGRADDTANRIRAVVYRALSGRWVTHHIRLDGEKMRTVIFVSSVYVGDALRSGELVMSSRLAGFYVALLLAFILADVVEFVQRVK